MKKVKIIVEGQTEFYFILDVLKSYMKKSNVELDPKVIGIPGCQGGHVTLKRAKDDILRYLRQGEVDIVTTFFDFYGIHPKFPGYDEVQNILKTGRSISAAEKAQILEISLLEEIKKDYTHYSLTKRFIPYIQMHEFEALLFSDSEIFAEQLENCSPKPFIKPKDIATVLSKFTNPEEINDNPATSPSKRIYGVGIDDNNRHKVSKVTFGSDVTNTIGIPKIRKQCPHFNEWLCKLESLSV